jgi:hypothetical protein
LKSKVAESWVKLLRCLTGKCLLFSYKDRFLASLPASRRASADFARPVFTAAAFYLCAKKHKVTHLHSICLSLSVGMEMSHLPVFLTNYNMILLVLQLKVDKIKLIELCGASESEFSYVRKSLSYIMHHCFLYPAIVFILLLICLILTMAEDCRFLLP